MIEDRDYMRDKAGDGRSGSLPALPAWLVILGLNVVVFLVQNASGPKLYQSFLQYGALSLDGLKHGFVWQFVTFQFMHGGLGHLVLNSVVLYSFGRPLEFLLGKRIFVSMYLVSGIAGGIAQILLALCSARFAGEMVGASAGICGLVAAFAMLSPESTIYLFFVLPIRAVYFLPLMIATTVLFIFIPSFDHVAHGAHLGGILAGVAWIKLGWHRDFLQLPWEGLVKRLRPWKPLQSRQRPREFVRAASIRRGPWQPAASKPESELPPEEFISKEVDPILDKISTHGIQSLTEREREILEAARARMSNR